MTKTKWLTVKQASQFCYEMGLPRSTKSIRRWCQFENVEAQKRQIANTKKWFIVQQSLEIKIKEELEFLKQSERQSDTPGQQTNMSGHDQTRPNVSGHEQTQADMAGRAGGQRPYASNGDTVGRLQEEIATLKIEVKFNEKMTDQFKKQYLKSQEVLIAQSRYIGHIETQVYRLGESPDLSFLDAPMPKSGRSTDDRVETNNRNPEISANLTLHPNQADLYSG